MNGMAAPIVAADGTTRGIVSIYGPAIRLTKEKMQEIAETLLATSRELAMLTDASPILKNAG